MSRDLQGTRAARARSGSNRQRDLDAAGMDRGARAAKSTASEIEARHRSEDARAWVSEHLPELSWRGEASSFAVAALLKNDRDRHPRNVEWVRRRMAAEWPQWPHILEPNEPKGATE